MGIQGGGGGVIGSWKRAFKLIALQLVKSPIPKTPTDKLLPLKSNSWQISSCGSFHGFK